MVCGNGAENRRCNPGSVEAKRDEFLAKVLVTAMTHKLAVCGTARRNKKRRGKALIYLVKHHKCHLRLWH